MCDSGACGALGWTEQQYVIVDTNAPYCKVINREFSSKELAQSIIEQNPRWRNVSIISCAEHAKAWNDRFWNN